FRVSESLASFCPHPVIPTTRARPKTNLNILFITISLLVFFVIKISKDIYSFNVVFYPTKLSYRMHGKDWHSHIYRFYTQFCRNYWPNCRSSYFVRPIVEGLDACPYILGVF